MVFIDAHTHTSALCCTSSTISIIEFNEKDIVRHPLVKVIVSAYSR